MNAPPKRDRLLEYFLANETWYGGEAHLRAINHGPVEWFGPAAGEGAEFNWPEGTATPRGPGWILRYGDPEAGEWNMARPIGDPARCLPLLENRPVLFDWQLIVPEEEADAYCVGNIQRMPSLHWYADDPARELPPVHEPDLGGDLANSAFLHLNQAPDHAYQWDLHLGFVRDRTIVSLLKAIHSTPHTLEVYVETMPSARRRGLARGLLGQAIRLARRQARQLIYVVAADNTSSIKVAESCGLVRIGTRARLHMPYRQPPK